jgi:hypothetical protein
MKLKLHKIKWGLFNSLQDFIDSDSKIPDEIIDHSARSIMESEDNRIYWEIVWEQMNQIRIDIERRKNKNLFRG